MRPFSVGELGRMQGTQESAMMDTCVHLQRNTTPDDYGNPVENWVEGDSFICGLTPPKSAEAMGTDETQVVVKKPQLRLPLSAESVIDSIERIKITHRFGVVLSNQPIYKIIGEPGRGPSGLVVNLELVTDGS